MFCMAACSKKGDKPGGPGEPSPKPLPPDELGAGWTKLQPNIGKFHDIHFVNDSTGYVCGKTVARTTDYGKTWTSFPLTEEEPYVELFSTDAAHCWVAGQNTLSITTDSGKNWTIIPFPVEKGSLAEICFFDNDNGVLCGKGGLFRSSDGGLHWTAVVQASRIFDISFINPQNGWYIEGKDIYRTQDGAGFTKIQTMPDTLLRIEFINLESGWLSDVKGNIFRTNDGGNTWNKVVSNLEKTNNYAIQFFGYDQGFILFSEAVYEMKGGAVSKVLSVPNNPLSDIQFTDADHGWAVSPVNNGVVYRYVR